MAASKEDIRGWLARAKRDGDTHMFVVCDNYDYDDYPVGVKPTEDINEVAAKFNGVNMQSIMECYDLSLDFESQMNEHRAWHGWSHASARKCSI